MSLFVFICGAIIIAVLSIATWDEDNQWKAWLLFIVGVMAMIGLRTGAYARGYDKGTCNVYEILDDRPDIELNAPERCDD